MKMTLGMLVLTLVCSASAAAPSNEAEEVKKSLKALLEPILQKQLKNPKQILNDFSVTQCEKYKINWLDVILMRKEAALTYRFKPGCDIEGVVNPTVIKPFPVDLKLKNLHHFERLQGQNKITASIETKPVMNLAVRSASLTGKKGVVKFEADYDVQIDPLKKGRNIVEKNLGGEIRISEIYGKKVSIKEKIKIE